MRPTLTALALLLMVVACGPIGGPGTPAVTASTVAVQSSDLPNGLTKCDLSGDINSYLTKIQTKDPSTYATIKSQWEAAKKDGATAAQVEFYTDSTAHCASLESSGSQIGTATYKLVVNFVFQFKDEASAVKGYTSDSIFGFSASSLRASQVPVKEGAATGLGPNSIVLTIAVSSQTFYVVVWQKKQFMVILGILNIDSATDKKVALAEDGRIH
ncbi:MAG TPA: hypothetical protein VG426_07840 [Candidatus Dormibacteraeota bacterium]|jgi:hypothetical protein|nr:hypothetical protein [Candidatus Dormibacteraeota bacterium]